MDYPQRFDEKKFGERLTDLILDKEINVPGLSKAICVAESIIHRWRKNISTPCFKHLIRVADYFQCSLDYLVGRKGDDDESHAVQKFKECPPFCERLKHFIELEKLSVKVSVNKICKNAKVARYAFTGFLDGSRHPLIENLVKLADYFDCSIDNLVGRER